MSLIVWLPLNGNLDNQGLSGVTVTNGGMTVNDSGKIGKCYSFANSNYLRLDNMPFSSLGTCSVSFWWYLNSTEDWLPCTGQSGSYYFMATSGGTGGFYHQNVGSNTITIYRDGVQGTTPLGAGAWHHYVITGLNLTSWTAFYINMYGSTGSGWNSTGRVNDFRIYDHNLSLKEIKEISKGLVLHYKFNDAYTENTTNLASQTYISGWNNSGNCSRTTNDTSLTSPCGAPVFSQTQTTAGQSAFCIGVTSSAQVSKTLTASTWFYRSGSTSGSTIGPYIRDMDHDNSMGCDFKYNGVSGYTNWPTDQWIYITGTFTTGSGAGRPYFCCYTGALNEKFAFSGWQIEEKDHATPYVNGTRTSSIIYDGSGYRNDGTAAGTIELSDTSPRYNKCTKFNSVGISTSYTNKGLDVFTYSAWVKLTSYHSERSCISIGGTYFTINNSGKLSGYAYGKSSEGYHTGSITIPLNTWTHVAIVWTTSQIIGYVNGVKDFAVNCTGNFTVATPHCIGSEGANRSSRVFTGYISDLREYVTALSAEDILELYHTAGSIDKSGTIFTYDYNESSGINKLSKSGVFSTSSITEDSSAYVRIQKGSSTSVGNLLANHIQEI